MKYYLTMICMLVGSLMLQAQPDPPDNPNGPPVPIEDDFWMLILLIVMFLVGLYFLRKHINKKGATL
jgi:hypothetical protein